MTILSAEMNGAAKGFRGPLRFAMGLLPLLGDRARLGGAGCSPSLRECLCFREEAAGYGRDERPSVHHSIT
jgi:hypothetical protein